MELFGFCWKEFEFKIGKVVKKWLKLVGKCLKDRKTRRFSTWHKHLELASKRRRLGPFFAGPDRVRVGSRRRSSVSRNGAATGRVGAGSKRIWIGRCHRWRHVRIKARIQPGSEPGFTVRASGLRGGLRIGLGSSDLCRELLGFWVWATGLGSFRNFSFYIFFLFVN